MVMSDNISLSRVFFGCCCGFFFFFCVFMSCADWYLTFLFYKWYSRPSLCPFPHFHCRRAHTVTVLFILTCALVYVTLLEETPQDTAYNTKRSVGCISPFLSVTKAKTLQNSGTQKSTLTPGGF